MDSAHEIAIQTTQECLRSFPDVIDEWKDYNFAQISYSKWACIEIIDELRSHPDVPPLITLESFRDRTDRYSLMSSNFLNSDKRRVFSIAYDTVNYIIDTLL